MRFSSRSFVLGGLAVVGGVHAAAADLDVAVVIQQFKNAFIVPDVLPSVAPSGLEFLTYGGTALTVGQDVPATTVASEPVITIQGTASSIAAANSPFNATASSATKYTFLLVDGNYAGSNNTGGYNFHCLLNDLTGTNVNDTVALGNGTARIPYAGPGPAAGTGPHRYIGLVWVQPANFAPPATPPANPGVKPFDLTAYITAAGFSPAIAVTYFTVTNGAVTVSVEPTSSVDPKTITQSSSGPSNTSSAPSSKNTNAAGRSSAVGAVGVVGAVSAVLAFLA